VFILAPCRFVSGGIGRPEVAAARQQGEIPLVRRAEKPRALWEIPGRGASDCDAGLEFGDLRANEGHPLGSKILITELCGQASHPTYDVATFRRDPLLIGSCVCPERLGSTRRGKLT